MCANRSVQEKAGDIVLCALEWKLNKNKQRAKDKGKNRYSDIQSNTGWTHRSGDHKPAEALIKY